MTKKRTKTNTNTKKKPNNKNKMSKDKAQEQQAVKEEKKDKATASVGEVEEKTEDKAVNEKTDQLAEQVLALEADVKEWKDKYMRLSAEFDNYRKRTLKEKSDLVRVANEDLLKDILPVVDDFERGMSNMDKSENIDALKEGVHLIHNKFVEFLKQKGIQEIDAAKKEFDIDFHEAVTKIPAPSEDLKGKVVDVIEKGYLLNEKVIRYAKVVVGE